MAYRVVESYVCENLNSYQEGYTLTNRTVWVKLECDTESDLPSTITYSIDTGETRGSVTLAIGSEAHCIGSNKIYMMQSDGTWCEQDEAARSDVYTRGEVNDLLQDMADSQANIDLAQDEDINANTDAIKALVDSPEPKNVLNLLSATTQTINGITFTVNSDYSITMTGTASATAFFSIPVTITPGQYYFSGMTESGGSSTYRLELRSPTATGTINLQNESATPTAWSPQTTYTGYFNIRVASGYSFGNLDSKTVYPMICPRWKYNISSDYVPYAPSNMELYNLIKSYHP